MDVAPYLYAYTFIYNFTCVLQLVLFHPWIEGHDFLISNPKRRIYSPPIMNEQRLRKVVSDVSYQIEKYEEETLKVLATRDEVVEQAECECCGLKEECSEEYISEIKGSHSGNWLCGLCSEAVKEGLARVPNMATQEAVSSHKDFCQKFNSTTRLNPKLSLAFAMRDIAKRSYENRRNSMNSSKLPRSASCVPRIN